MAKRKGLESEDVTGGVADANAETQHENVGIVLAKIKKARNIAMDCVESCRTVVKLSSLGEDVLVNDFSAHVAAGIDKAVEGMKEATELMAEAAKLFAPYAK